MISKKFSKYILFFVFFVYFCSYAFAATKNIVLVQGYNKSNKSLNWAGIGSNTSVSVVRAIDGLESLIEQELKSRCEKIRNNFNDENISFFVDGINGNMNVIKREMIRKAFCSASYQTDVGEYVAYYSIKNDSFEEIFEKYINKFNDDSDEMKVYTGRIKSINRFFKNKFDFQNNIQVRVK